jgi:hypothetical protein
MVAVVVSVAVIMSWELHLVLLMSWELHLVLLMPRLAYRQLQLLPRHSHHIAGPQKSLHSPNIQRSRSSRHHITPIPACTTAHQTPCTYLSTT